MKLVLSRRAALLAVATLCIAIPNPVQASPAPGPTKQERVEIGHSTHVFASGNPLMLRPPEVGAGRGRSGQASKTAALGRNRAIQQLSSSDVEAPLRLWEDARTAYLQGYFSDALATWREIWMHNKDNPSQATAANLAIADWAALCARVGRRDELEQLFLELGDRPFRGRSAQVIRQAKEGLNFMIARPDLAYRCGPAALERIASRGAGRFVFNAGLYNSQSSANGISLLQLQKYAAEAGMDFQVAKRTPGASFITPSVIHWKLGHYAGLTEVKGGHFHIEDPTFAEEFWVGAEALETESSGYFLVPAGPLPEGWEAVAKDEAELVWGKGQISSRAPNTTRTSDMRTSSDGCGGKGMAEYSAHLHMVSLRLHDTPFVWHSKVGPPIPFTVYYNEKDLSSDGVVNYSNFGDQWTHQWHSRISFSAVPEGFVLTVELPGGGSESYQVNGGMPVISAVGGQVVQVSPHSRYDGTRMSLIWQGVAGGSGGVIADVAGAIREFADGSAHYYTIAESNDTSHLYLKYVRTSELSPDFLGTGASITVNYENHGTANVRIAGIVDAEPSANPGIVRFYYADSPNLLAETGINSPTSSNPLRILAAKDPAGRLATFRYDSSDRLIEIKDPVGIVSAFTYEGASDRVASLATPYGTSRFSRGSGTPASGVVDWLEMRDPLGLVERVEYNQNPPGIGRYELPEPNRSEVLIRTSQTNEYRNTFYWDKKASYLGKSDYTKARIFHWIHGDSMNESTGVLESYKEPLENRVYYNYLGMVQHDDATFAQTATSLFPSKIARLLPDGTTQVERYTYNSFGNITKYIDPVGRETAYEYAANKIDLLEVKQKQGASYVQIASFRYNDADSPRQPSSVIDAAGRSTTFDYNRWGQVTSTTNGRGEVTGFQYDTFYFLPDFTIINAGNLHSVYAGAPDNWLVQFGYDSANRVRTRTDPFNSTLTFDYDALDRLRTITYPDSTTEQIEYNGRLLPERTTDRLGQVRDYRYNGNRQLVGSSVAGELTQLRWCACGLLQSVTDAAGQNTFWEYDVQGRLIFKRFPDQSTQHYEYEVGSSRLKKLIRPDGAAVEFNYTLDDQVAKVSYGNAVADDEHFDYDPVFPRLSSSWKGEGGPTSGYSYTYHPNRSALATAPPFADGAGLISTISGPLSNDTRSYGYDPLGRVERRSLINDDLSVGQEELFTYDSLGRPEVLTDALGAATSVYLPRSGILDYGLLADGRYKRAHQYFDASTHPVTSANYMRLREVAYQRIAGGASSPLSASTYDYRVDGLIKQFDRSVSGQGMQETSYLYNSHGRLAESSASGLTNQYRYSKSGDLIRMDTKGAVKTFTEGLGGQVRYARAASDAGVLRGSVDEYATVEVDGRPTVLRGDLSFEAPLTGLDSASALTITAEDISNNLRTSTYQVSTNGVIREYSYDRNGRLERQTAAGAEMVYEWDAADRLLAIQTAKSPVAGTKRTEFIYDVLDQRTGIIEKAFDGANWATTAHDTFVWADGELVQKRDATGSIIRRRYLRDGFIDVDTAGVGRGYIVTRDHLGSAREVVEVDTGVVVARYDYDAFGTPTRQGSVHEDRLFSGHYYHASSGLHLAWARAYDSTNGRWLSRDPLIWAEALPEGTSAYAYVGNDPVNRVDPLGLCFQSAKSRPPSRPAASQQDFTHGFVIPGDADAGLLAGFLRNNGRNSERALYYLNEIWNQRNAMNSAAGKGSEVVRSFDSFNAARSAARKAAGLGDDVVPFVSEIGPLKGRVTGMMSSDGLKGWRLDYDKGKGFHVNWWNRTAGPNRAQWSYGANHVLGKSHDDFLNLLEHAFPK